MGKCEFNIYRELIESRADMRFGLVCSEYSQGTRLRILQPSQCETTGSKGSYVECLLASRRLFQLMADIVFPTSDKNYH